MAERTKQNNGAAPSIAEGAAHRPGRGGADSGSHADPYERFLGQKRQLGGRHGFEPRYLPDFLFP